MRLMKWLKGDSGRDRARERPRKTQREERSESAKGDFRGRYGFGRRAHRPDPDGRYLFENKSERPRRNPDPS